MPGSDHILNKAFLATGGSVAYVQFMVMQQVAAVGLVPAAVQICPTAAGAAGANSISLAGIVQEPLDAAKTNTGKAFVNVAVQGTSKAIWDGTTGGTTPWATNGVTPTIGCLVVPSATTAGRVKFIPGNTGFVGFALVGALISLPGSPLPTFGANAAAGDLFDVALAGFGERV